MPDPFLDRHGDALYLVDREGTTWYVHVATFGDNNALRLSLGAGDVTGGHVVAADGARSVC